MPNTPVVRKCPFRNPVITRSYTCEFAVEVTLREGPGISCDSFDAHERCTKLFQDLKTVTLSELKLDDDLTQIPSGTLNKIQFAGLAALSKLAGGDEASIENINKVVVAFDITSEESISPEIVSFILAYKLKRRRAR